MTTQSAQLEQQVREALERNGVIAEVSLDDEDDSVWISGPQGRIEEWTLAPDVRHGESGYRALRYMPRTPTSVEWNWDETYQFYETLDALALALKSGDYAQGRAAF